MRYLDAEGRETTPEAAARFVIVEYDANNNPIHRTYGVVPRPGGKSSR